MAILETNEEEHAVIARQSIESRIQVAASTFVIHERAKHEIVHNQLSQFCEILSVKIRQCLLEYKIRLNKLRPKTRRGPEASIGSLSSLGTALLPINQTQTALSAAAALLLVVWRVSFSNVVALASVKLGVDAVSRFQTYLAIARCENFIRAFSPGGDDEVETEKNIRKLTVGLGARFLDQATRLSKVGQRVLSDVIVRRLSLHLSRHANSYVGESMSPLSNALQHFKWDLLMKLQRLLRPGDHIRTKPALPFLQRCVRAVTMEYEENSECVLEMNNLFKSADHVDAQGSWTAHGVLSCTGVCVFDESATPTLQYFAHKRSQTSKYGYCYGNHDEVVERNMELVHSNAPREDTRSPEVEVTPPPQPRKQRGTSKL